MNAMILATWPRQFQQLATDVRQGRDYEADLAALVERLGEAAGNGPDRRASVEKVRGQLRMREQTLGIPEPMLPEKLTDPGNQCERAFYADAIVRMTALIEEA